MENAGRISKEDARRLLGECSPSNGLSAKERAQLLERVATRPFAAGGTGRDSINECLRSWRRRGIVRIHDRVLTIANRTALQDLAGAWAPLAAIVPALQRAVSP